MCESVPVASKKEALLALLLVVVVVLVLVRGEVVEALLPAQGGRGSARLT